MNTKGMNLVVPVENIDKTLQSLSTSHFTVCMVTSKTFFI